MATHVNLQFNDGKINLSTSSFLFKQSKLLQSIDIDEDNNIPILCLRSYVLDENETCLFDDKTDLSFMFTLLPNKFLDVCKFLDIICYENKDNAFSEQFIIYIMTNIKEDIHIIRYFMQDEIRSIMNYLNNEDVNLQIKSCTPVFYALYLSEHKEEVIKHNRIDIFELSTDKYGYYRYIHKYNNHLTIIVKETQKYKDYIVKISKNLINECDTLNNINNIRELVEQGAYINLQDKCGRTALHFAAARKDNIEVIKYLVEHGADIHLNNVFGNTALHYASHINNTLEVVKYLVDMDCNVNLQNRLGHIALYYASRLPNNEEVINYLKQFN